MTDANRLSASEIQVALRRQEITCTEIAEACLSRIAERESVVGAWAFLDPELVLDGARALDRCASGAPLRGVPVGVKDVIDTADMPTEMGSPIYQGYRPRADASCVAFLRNAGALIVGKTITAEFAGTYPGKTANPLDLSRTPGGSSSGSAAAVADFMVPAALGTQTGGSVLRPASFCGVFGFKPSFGRYDRAGIKAAAESLDTIGLIARCLDDIRLFDAALLPNGFVRQRLTDPPRIGLCRTHLWSRAQAGTKAAIENAARRMEAAGAEIREIKLPAEFADLTLARETINNFERARGLAYEWHKYRADISERLGRSIEKGIAVSWEQYRSATDLVLKWRRDFAVYTHDCDAVLAPCVPGEAPKGLDDTGDPKFQELWTLLHLPTLALPTHCGENGLPIAIQLVGRCFDDGALLDVADWVWSALSPAG